MNNKKEKNGRYNLTGKLIFFFSFEKLIKFAVYTYLFFLTKHNNYYLMRKLFYGNILSGICLKWLKFIL